ncbi:MAG: phage holin family protein [Calditrichaeota bacterium]|nr:MAG: phage holin family protein [Calditrichota bacterium]MBL1205734.1 phage holin family protein [Calditrichota bacterium]NOG45562.1 phage holin family protein [Calditrichota bacterium]
MNTLWNVLLLSITIFAVAKFLPNIRIKNFITAIIVAVVYSIINFFIGWLLVLLSLPVMFLTLGLFTFVINAFLLWVTDQLIEDFEIKNFSTTLLAAFLITVISTLLKWIF